MNFPTVPVSKMVDSNGMLTAEWQNFFFQMWTFFQVNMSEEGLVSPSLTTANIALLANAQNGTFVYNTTTDKAMVKQAGTFVNIV